MNYLIFYYGSENAGKYSFEMFLNSKFNEIIPIQKKF